MTNIYNFPMWQGKTKYYMFLTRNLESVDFWYLGQIHCGKCYRVPQYRKMPQNATECHSAAKCHSAMKCQSHEMLQNASATKCYRMPQCCKMAMWHSVAFHLFSNVTKVIILCLNIGPTSERFGWFLSDKGPMLEMLDYTIRTLTFLYFNMF